MMQRDCYVYEIDPLRIDIERGVEYDSSGTATRYTIKNESTKAYTVIPASERRSRL